MQQDSSISRISLERTACFGTCPVYEVSVFADGSVTFTGTRFVESVGDYSTQIGRSGFRRLVEFSEDIGFFDLDDEYRYGRAEDGSRIVVSDLPSRITTIYRDGEVKSVLNYFRGPEELEQFERLIDTVANTAQWVGEDAPGF